jgi:triosephosphate isomerase
MIPKLIINFKNYEKGTYLSAISLAKICEKVSLDTGFSIGVCVNSLDFSEVKASINIPVFLQHSDYFSFGAHTGAVLPELAKFHGADGVLLNHAEKPISAEVLGITVKECKRVHLPVLLVCSDLDELREYKKFDADIFIFEHCDAMGSCVSIVDMKPELIEKVPQVLGDKLFMLGAGINNSLQTKKALKRGAFGVLVSNAVVNSKEPEKKLRELVSAFKS